MHFLRQVLHGTKQLLHMTAVRQVTVPKLKEFNSQQLYEQALQDEKTRDYLPDREGFSRNKPVGRSFVFNVSLHHTLYSTALTLRLQIINSRNPGFFEERIKRAYRDRRENESLSSTKFIDVDSSLLQLIKDSNYVSKGKSLLPHDNDGFSSSRQGLVVPQDDIEEEVTSAVRPAAPAAG